MISKTNIAGKKRVRNVVDLYRDLCNKLGKEKVWNFTTDELCDYIEENYIIYSTLSTKNNKEVRHSSQD